MAQFFLGHPVVARLFKVSIYCDGFRVITLSTSCKSEIQHFVDNLYSDTRPDKEDIKRITMIGTLLSLMRTGMLLMSLLKLQRQLIVETIKMMTWTHRIQ